tara:strand:+ start:80 stop:1075 length:996 start_codon:yes stop_codon:yes gene_type:complete
MPQSSGLGFTSWGSTAPELAAATRSIPVMNSITHRQRDGDVEASTSPPASRINVPGGQLTAWNGAMFLFHTILATVTLVVGNNDLSVPLFRTRLDFRFNNETASGELSSGELPWEIIPTYEQSISLPFTWLVAIFFILSATFHLLNATVLRTFYLTNLEQCYSPTRWIEYTLSAPIMILLISYTLGIRNQEVLLSQFVLVMVTMPFGYWVEVVSRPKSPDEWNGSLMYRLYPWFLGHIPQITAWYLIIATFYGGQDQVDRAPWFVHLILWFEFVLFFSFGAASVLSQWNTPEFFYRGEILFQVLSLISKGLLGLILLANVLMLSRFDDLYD